MVNLININIYKEPLGGNTEKTSSLRNNNN